MSVSQITYAEAILDGFRYLLSTYANVFVMGQGLWSPWYVGTTMRDLDRDFGRTRIIDSPVSEVAVTGAGVGASICGYRPIIVHPRMDFMILAVDQIVSQAAKWSHMFGGQARAPVTIRGIINRGGEQGAQHSQALHAWFAHIPGLRVVMPATPQDARDLLIASVLSDDPVLYIDDRWLYNVCEEVPPITEKNLSEQRPRVLEWGADCSLVGSGYSTHMCMKAAKILDQRFAIKCDVIDLRVINPLDYVPIVDSVVKTGRLVVVDGGWRGCGLAGEVIACVVEHLPVSTLKSSPIRLTLPNAPAPASGALESIYYTSPEDVVDAVRSIL